MSKAQPKTTRRATGGNGTAAALGPSSEIGRKLKQYYDDLVTEEVPERFATLLRQLEDKERDGSERKDGS
jgi:hypothetical protein